MADYSSCDGTNLNGFLQSLGNEYSVYTYDMLNAGIDRDTLMSINEEQLLGECGIRNKIHRIKIQQGVKVERGEFSSITDEGSTIDKTLDVFISYRRSNGSQLASLLKVHLGKCIQRVIHKPRGQFFGHFGHPPTFVDYFC